MKIIKVYMCQVDIIKQINKYMNNNKLYIYIIIYFDIFIYLK